MSAPACSPLRASRWSIRRARMAAITDEICRAAGAPPEPRLVGRCSPSPRARCCSGVGCVSYQIATGIGDLGAQPDRRLGLRHHQLRLLGRHRPRRHAHLGHPVPLPAEVAHQHQPLGRGDDPLRGHVRGAVPAHPHGPPLAGLLDVPLPEHPRPAVGQLPLAAALGRVRHQHLLHRLAGVLVPRAHPRPGDAARPGDAGSLPPADLLGLLAFGWNGSTRTWIALRDGLPAAGRALPRRWCCRVHTIVSMDFATSVIPGWHTTIFPPYFVAGAVFTGFAMVLTLMIIARKVLGFEHLHHRPPPREHDQGDPRHRAASSGSPTRPSSSPPGTRATPTSASPSSTARSGPTPGPTGRW